MARSAKERNAEAMILMWEKNTAAKGLNDSHKDLNQKRRNCAADRIKKYGPVFTQFQCQNKETQIRTQIEPSAECELEIHGKTQRNRAIYD